MMETSEHPSMDTQAVVAAFDFDGTLTLGDTLIPFLIRSLGWPRFLLVITLSLPWLAAFFLRLIKNHQAKARLLQFSFAGWTQERAQQHAKDFVQNYLPAQWRAWGLAQLVQHQRLGHHCVIVSASPDIYLREVATSLKVQALLCTGMELRDGRYTGQMATPNCHGAQKVIRLRAWINDNLGPNIQPELYAYGDSKGDLQLLELADHAWYRGRDIPKNKAYQA
jgi:phosphatidylglycerophosphatase C